MHGDGRTLPQHFDPQVLRVFSEATSEFEEIYETFGDRERNDRWTTGSGLWR